VAEGVIHLFGSNPGALVPTVLIPSTQVAANNQAQIADFKVTASLTSSNSVFQMQRSTDNFVANNVEMDRIELPVGGTFLVTYSSGLKILGGQWIRVIFTQTVAGTVSATLHGGTSNGDIQT